MPPAAILEMMGGDITPSGKNAESGLDGNRSASLSLSNNLASSTKFTNQFVGGDIAAFLSYSVMTGGENKSVSGKTISPLEISKDAQDHLKNFGGSCVPFPQLTEEEKKSPLGLSIVYVMGLFSSLSAFLLASRSRESTNSFASGTTGAPSADLSAMITAENAIPSHSIYASVNASGVEPQTKVPQTHATSRLGDNQRSANWRNIASNNGSHGVGTLAGTNWGTVLPPAATTDCTQPCAQNSVHESAKPDSFAQV